MVFPNVKSTVDRVATAAKESTAANRKLGRDTTRDEGKEQAKPIVILKKVAGTTSKPSLNLSVVGVATFSKKEVGGVDDRLMTYFKGEMDAKNMAVTEKKPADANQKPTLASAAAKMETKKYINTEKSNVPVKVEQLSGAMPTKSTVDAVLDPSSSSAKKQEIYSAFTLSTAPSTSSDATAGIVGLPVTDARVARKEKHQTDVTAAIFEPILASFVSACPIQREPKATRLVGNCTVTSSNDMVLDSPPRTAL
eukprot:jgi/Undpi1/7053/HiC_scaffold_21.g09527.m1